ncbi:MAG: VWA domain-containing protein, partial [Synergistaceae bacterium]|nr:VWA domain-containing protein [Synergistaceae bacterium]MBR2209819.1 VWA domain-containing protein [Synergistaceae bacterium]
MKRKLFVLSAIFLLTVCVTGALAASNSPNSPGFVNPIKSVPTKTVTPQDLTSASAAATASTAVSVKTSSIDNKKYPYQASAVLIAPKDYPYPEQWPSANFDLNIKFTPSGSIPTTGTNTSADFVFIIDTTGSMATDIEKVKAQVSSFSNAITEKGVDLRFAVIEYRDITVDGAGSTKIHTFASGGKWTSDSSEVASCLESLTAEGGGDGPETPTNAFAKMLSELGFRAGASHFAFLLTDAPSKGNGVIVSDTSDSTEDYDYIDEIEETASDDQIVQMSDIITDSSRFYIRTSVVSYPRYEEHYSSLFKSTGGTFIDINGEGFADEMLTFAQNISDTTTTAASVKLDVLERGSISDYFDTAPAKGMIENINDSGSYVDSDGNAVTETSLAALANIEEQKYRKGGFTADGNTRLILRVQTTQDGVVTFSIPENLGGKLESLQSSSETTAKDSTNSIETSRSLIIHAVPVVLIHGFTKGSTVDGSYGKSNTDKGIRGKLNAAGMKDYVFACNYQGENGPRTNIPSDTANTKIFKQIAKAV